MVSALHEDGLAEVWGQIEELMSWRRETGVWERTRQEQARYWLGQEVRNALLSRLETAEARAALKRLGDRVAAGELAPSVAARSFLAELPEPDGSNSFQRFSGNHDAGQPGPWALSRL